MRSYYPGCRVTKTCRQGRCVSILSRRCAVRNSGMYPTCRWRRLIAPLFHTIVCMIGLTPYVRRRICVEPETGTRPLSWSIRAHQPPAKVKDEPQNGACYRSFARCRGRDQDNHLLHVCLPVRNSRFPEEW